MLSHQDHARLRVLLFDPLAANQEPLFKAMHDQAVRIQPVVTANEFEAALAESEWDAVLLTYADFTTVLQRLEFIGEKFPVILICENQTEADFAYQLPTERVVDVLIRGEFNRLGFILRRELRQRSSSIPAQNTEQTAVAASLARSETRFRSVIEGFNDPILFVDQYQIIRYANVSALTRNFGFHISHVIGRPLADFLHADEKPRVEEKLREALKAPDTWQSLECKIRRADANWEVVELSSHSMNDPNGHLMLILHIHVITQQKNAEQDVKKLYRTLSVLSDVNQAIVRIRDIAALFDAACKIAVEKGAFRMAWIGVLDTKTRRVTPMAYAGLTDDYIEKLNISLDDPLRSSGPTGRALKTGTPVVSNDVQNDFTMQPWQADAQRLGYHSVTSLPLLINGEARGVLALYAAETNFFDDAELKLVIEMAGDIAFAMEFAQQEEQRQQAEATVQRYAKRMEVLHEIDSGLLRGGSLETLIQITLKNLRLLIPCQQANVILINREANEGLIYSVDYKRESAYAEGIRYPLPEGAFDGYDERHVRIFDDIRLLPESNARAKRLASEGLISGLSVFMMHQDTPIASLSLLADTPGFFNAEYQEIAIEISNQLAIVLHQQQLSDELAQHTVQIQRYAKRMEILHEIDTGIISATSIQSVIEIALKHIRQLIRCQRVSVMLLDEKANEWLIFSADVEENTSLGSGTRIPNLSTRSSEVVNGRIAFTPDLRLLPDHSPAIEQLIQDGLVSALHAHFVVANHSIGSLNFFADTADYFTAEDQEIAAEVADQIAIAVRQMQLSNDIHQSESQYRLLAENMADVVWMLDLGTARFTYMSPSIQQLRGYTPEEVLNQTLAETLTPASLHMITDALPERIQAYVSGDSAAISQRYEVEQPCKDGSTVWTEVVTTILQDDNGAIRILGVSRNITERRQAEAELREREEWIRLSMEASDLGKWRLDIKTGVIRFDERARLHYGFDRNTVTVDEVLAHVHPDDLERFKREFSASTDPAGNPKAVMEYRVVYPDGSEHWLSVLSHIYFEGQGSDRHAVYSFGTSQDITARKQAEQALRQTEERYRRVVEDQTELICRYKPDFTLTFVNPAYVKVFGHDQVEFIGMNIFDLMPPEDHADAKTYLASITISNPVAISEHRSVLADGSKRWIQWTDRALFDDEGHIIEYQGVGRDITERKRLELEREENLRVISDLGNLFRSALDAFPANAVILDPTGTIIAVNKPWLNFAMDNDETKTDYIGTNYLTTCDSVVGPESEDAKITAEGIRAVISGIQDYFTMEYPCHSTTEKRWFSLHISAFTEPAPRRVVVSHINITERKLAEEAINRQNAILHQSRDLIGMADINSKLIYMNASGAALAGYESAESVIGTSITDYYTPEDMERIRSEYMPIALSTGGWRGENRLKTIDGKLIDVDQTIFPIRDEKGNLQYYATIMADITKRKQAEDALHQTQLLFQEFMGHLPGTVFITDHDHILKYCNSRYAESIGKQRDELIGNRLTDYLLPDRLKLFLEENQQVISTMKSMEFNYSVVDNDQITHWLLIKFPIPQSNSQPLIGAITLDVTKEKLAETALRNSEAQQRAILTAIPDIMFRYSADGTMVDYHAPDSELLVTSPELFLGKKTEDVLPGELAEELSQNLKHVLSTKEPLQMEYSLNVISGIREFEARLVPVGDDEVLAIVRDVTERKMAEQELQALYNATSTLFKADSLLALGQQIVATVVHEFEHADCGIMLLDKSKNNVLRLARTGQADIHPDTPLRLDGDGLVPQALRTGEIIYAPDVSQNNHYVANEASTQSEFVIPLKTANGIIGVLDLQHAQKNAFNDRDRRILTAYAERAAPAIEIMQLYDELNRHASDLEWRVAQRTVELNHAKERAEAILNHSADGIVLMDSDLVIQQTNLAFNALFSVWPDAYFEKSFMDLLEAEEIDRVNQIFKTGLIDRKGQRIETRARRKDGTTFDAELGIGFIKNSGLVCIIRDISERKQAEKAIAEERNLLRTLIDALPDYIYVKDIHHKTLLSNLARTRSFGLVSPEETIGKDDFDFVPSGMAAQYHADEDRLFKTLEPLIDHEELTIGMDGSTIWAASTKVPFRNLNGELIGLVGVTRDITEQKLREEQLRQSEEQLRQSQKMLQLVMDTIPVRVFWKNRQSVLLGCNRLFAQDAGFDTADALLAKSPEEQVKLAAEESLYQADEREILATGIPKLDYEETITVGNHEPLLVQTSKLPLRNDQGDIIGILGVYADISERKKAEQALRESEMRFGLLVNGVRDYAIYLVDPDGKIITWNQGAERIKGYTAQEIVGRNISAFYTPEDIASHQPQNLLSTAKAQGHFLTEGKRVRKDGSVFWAEIAVTALKDSSGHLFGYAKVTHDLSERQKAQETLRLSEERYRLLAENITDIISRLTPDGTYIDVSPSCKSVLGYTPEEMIGKQTIEFVHPDDLEALQLQRQEILAKRLEIPITYRFRHRQGHYIWLEVARKFILTESGEVKEYVTSARDITIRKRAEQALKSALGKEKELSELKSRFVSMASHEFRTPLATILATTETLSAYRSKLNDTQINEKLVKISDQVGYLKSIIEDMLQVARLQDPKAKYEPVNIDLAAVCRSAIDEFESRSDVTQHFVYTISDAPYQIQLDRKLMRQIISNLLSNAVKYSAANSTITLKLDYQEAMVVLKVQDQGMGIPEADLKHLFEPFHRAANVGTIPGTGLGLLITKEAVELHGGLITVESKLGEGTSFTIMIPSAAVGGL